MREYGQIQCSYWERAREEGWSSDATLLGAYLMTGPHSNGVGCYRLPDSYIAADLGWSSERVSETLSELFRNGFAKRFGTVVLMPNFLRFNPISNGNVAKARQGEFESIPNDEAKNAAARGLLEFGNHWAEGFRNRLETLSKGLPKGYGKQNPTQPNPTQTEEQKPATVVALPSADDFSARMWAAWKALPDGGGGAYLSRLIKTHGADRVLEAVERAIDAKPAEPKAYLQGLLRASAKDDDDYENLFRTAQ